MPRTLWPHPCGHRPTHLRRHCFPPNHADLSTLHFFFFIFYMPLVASYLLPSPSTSYKPSLLSLDTLSSFQTNSLPPTDLLFPCRKSSDSPSRLRGGGSRAAAAVAFRDLQADDIRHPLHKQVILIISSLSPPPPPSLFFSFDSFGLWEYLWCWILNC